MDDSEFYELLLAATRITLSVEHYFQPDGVYADFYTGPSVVAVAFSKALAALTPEGRVVCALSTPQIRELVAAAKQARTEERDEGVDTATGRPITSVDLRFDDPRGRADSFLTALRINYLGNHCPLPDGWSRLVTIMRDAIGPISGVAADAWDHVTRWLAPVELPASWSAGAATRLPHVVTAFEHPGAFYLRVGQPPGRSTLYSFRAKMLVNHDTQTLIFSTDSERATWVLPCGGGTISACGGNSGEGEWAVVRSNDPDRPIYVQHM